MEHVDICLITPLHPSMNPRLVKEADALSQAGYQVAVIAPDFSKWGREADTEFSARPWRIVERPPFGPQAPRALRIAELSRRLAARVAVQRLGVEHPALVRAAWHPVAPALVRAAKRQKANLYVAHLVAALPAAAIAAQHHGARYAFDAEDFHPGDLPEGPQSESENRLLQSIESRYLPACAYVTAASPGIADAYRREYGISRPVVVLNTFPRSRAPVRWTPAGAGSPAPSLYWFSQTIGPERGIECAVKAIARSQARPHLYLRGAISRRFEVALEALALSEGVAGRVHILPVAPPEKMEELAAGYDIGLSGETGQTPNRRIALVNKVFTYLLAGLPILMSDIPAHRSFVTELGGAARLFPIDDPIGLAAAMDAWLADAGALASARKAAWTLGQQRFNWELESETLVRTVASIMPRSMQNSVGRAHGAYEPATNR